MNHAIDRVEETPKAPYTSPELVRYGSLDELTQAVAAKAPTVDQDSLP